MEQPMMLVLEFIIGALAVYFTLFGLELLTGIMNIFHAKVEDWLDRWEGRDE